MASYYIEIWFNFACEGFLLFTGILFQKIYGFNVIFCIKMGFVISHFSGLKPPKLQNLVSNLIHWLYWRKDGLQDPQDPFEVPQQLIFFELETKILKFMWLLDSSDQNGLDHTPLLSTICCLGERIFSSKDPFKGTVTCIPIYCLSSADIFI